MHEVHVVGPAAVDDENKHLAIVATAGLRIDSGAANIYRTFVPSLGHSTVLTTTSKNIHLFLGRMTWEELRAFKDLIVRELKLPKRGEIMIVFYNKEKDGRPRRLIRVTVAVSGFTDQDNFELSQVNG